MAVLTKDVLKQLAAPFPASVIQWKPQATTKAGDKALAVAYIDARDVMRRLDDVAGGEWSFEWEPVGDAVRGALSVYGVTRCDVGEEGDGPMGKTLKAAVSDALKRCAVHFGVGRYLYYLDGKWVKYDAQSKKLIETPQLPSWALPGQQATVPQDAPAVAADEHDDASADNGNGHVALPAIEPNATMIIQDADKIKSVILDIQAKKEDDNPGWKGKPATGQQRQLMARMLDLALGDNKGDEARHAVYGYLYGVTESEAMTMAQTAAVLDFVIVTVDKQYQLKTTAAAQVTTLYRAAQLVAGQKELAA